MVAASSYVPEFRTLARTSQERSTSRSAQRAVMSVTSNPRWRSISPARSTVAVEAPMLARRRTSSRPSSIHGASKPTSMVRDAPGWSGTVGSAPNKAAVQPSRWNRSMGSKPSTVVPSELSAIRFNPTVEGTLPRLVTTTSIRSSVPGATGCVDASTDNATRLTSSMARMKVQASPRPSKVEDAVRVKEGPVPNRGRPSSPTTPTSIHAPM